MRKDKNKNKKRKNRNNIKDGNNIKYDNFHAKVLWHIKNGNKPTTASPYGDNPSHLIQLIEKYASEGERHPVIRVAQEAIDSVLQREEEQPLSHSDPKPFDPKEVGMAALIFTAATDTVWAYLTYAKLGVDWKKTDNFWEQTGAQQLYTFLTAIVVMPLVMLAIAKKYDKDLKEAARIAANVGVATIISVIPFNIFAKYGPELLGIDPMWAFVFPGIIEGPLQAASLVIGNLMSAPHYVFDKIEFAIAASPLSWFAIAWQGMFQLISGAAIAEPYRSILVTTLVPTADTAALYASVVMINASANHSKKSRLDAIKENPDIITKHPMHRERDRAVDLTRGAVASTMPHFGLVDMLRRLGGSPLHNQQLPGSAPQSTMQQMREGATQLMSNGYDYVRRKLFG